MGVSLQLVKVKKALAAILVSLFFLATLGLVIAPLWRQASFRTVSKTVRPGPYVYEKEFVEAHLNDNYSATVDYQLYGSPREWSVYSTFQTDVKTSSSIEGRIIIINYTFISNGIEVRSIEENWVNITSLSGASGTYDEKLIPTEALKTGSNILTINANVTSYMTNPNETSQTSLYINIMNISIKAISADLDSDGIIDALDPINGANNYHLLLVLAIVQISFGFYVQRRL